jgi:chemotaxis protein methyltransferase CheR
MKGLPLLQLGGHQRLRLGSKFKSACESFDVTPIMDDTLDKMFQFKPFGRSPVAGFLRLNLWTWNHLPASSKNLRLVQLYGHFLNTLVRSGSQRTQYFGTFFLRNRPQLELIRRLSYEVEHTSTLNLAVLGCSNGAEVYSILATLRSARPELKVVLNAVDISPEVLALARKGMYSIVSPELVGETIFERLSEAEIQMMFDRDADQVTVQSWIKEGIHWQLGDVRDPEVLQRVGPQDIVVANNFLCHMKPPQAEECLRGIAPLVRPGGYLVISGIDLEVREKVALAQNWKPVPELLEAIHDGDTALREDWPTNYWGLEPLDKTRGNWTYRYAAVFQIGEPASQRTRIPLTETSNVPATLRPVLR